MSSPSPPLPSEPVDPNRTFTLAQLAAYNGTDKSKPLYLGCAGKVYDVTAASGFYGPGGAYGVFAGKDASRGLAKMEIGYTTADISDLTASERQTLKEWEDKYDAKYTVVGRIVDNSEPHS
jgi:membrane-associated progesterone receptor component